MATIISFYTNDWIYPEHALRLKAECDNFGLSSLIKEMPSTKDYIKNTAIKPFFIRDTLLELKSPVIWIDVDAKLLKAPSLDFEGFDIGACAYTNSRLDRTWAVATLYFNYTEQTQKFLDAWCENSNSGTDENSFDITWNQLSDSVKFKELPATYHFVKWRESLEVPEDIVICHQLSKFEDKMRRKRHGQVDEGMK